jgi:dUTP pyrophosphatase
MIEIKVVNKSSHDLPKFSTQLSAGVDLRAYLVEPVVVRPLGRVLVPTGLFMELPAWI